MAALMACGPTTRNNGGDDTQGGGDAGVDAYLGPVTVLSGRVWAPKWAPGDVPAGQEIPIAGAILYLSQTRPAAIPDHVYCEQCIDAPGGSITSGADGSFTMTVAPGDYWFVIQKGQFRLEQQVHLDIGAVAFPPQQTTLPARMDPANGAWIPRIAIARGNYDAVEDILGKIGFGQMSGTGLSSGIGENAFEEIKFYDYGGSAAGSVTYLLQNIDEMRKYNIIFFPCSTNVDDTVLNNQNTLKNIRTFVNEGGKLYVTDWAGETADMAFPPQITLGDSGADTVGTYDPIALTGTISAAGDADGSLYNAPDGKAVDPGLAAWLGLQTGPSESDPTPHMYDPNNFEVVDNWNWIKKMDSVMIGTDMNGQPVYDQPKAWLTGTSPSSGGPKPLVVTYQPTGCGKVLHSTFQTSGASASDKHAGLMPQERVLLYLIMEIAACTTGPVIQ
ncbi:MAG: hypothetical protein NT062_26470 [Proteobacteria bacterium]|nr:hypothetical protein [Pseudomonadota bacterium]